MGKTSLYRPVAGIHRDDIARLNLALAGVSYPAQKWQLIAHAEREPVGRGRPDRRTIDQLWALPTGRYRRPRPRPRGRRADRPRTSPPQRD